MRQTTRDPGPSAPPVVIEPALARAALAGRRIGPHVPIAAGLAQAAAGARETGAGTIAVFTDNPTAWEVRAEPHPGLQAFRLALRGSDIELQVHASYLVNLAAPDPVVADRSVERMIRELDIARAFGARSLNVHIGSHKGTGIESGVERVGAALARVLQERDENDAEPRLVLEDSAGQGGGVGVTVEELADVLEAAGRAGADVARLGVCLDTAHLWGAGYEVDDPDAIDALLDRVDALMGPAALALVHVNDSRVRRGTRMDRHEHIGGGAIGARGLAHLVAHPRLAGVPMILETPGMDGGWGAVNMARIRELLAGEPLAPLPPEAALARTGRS